MPIPTRTNAADYHYHVYDYNAAAPYTASPDINNRGQFYSLVCDLKQLVVDGKTNRVPGIKLMSLGGLKGSADERATTMCLCLGNGDSTAPNIVLTGGIHAREWIAPEVTYLIAEYLVRNYSLTPPPGSYQAQLSGLINSRNIYIIPMLNPIGNWYSVNSPDANSRLWRRNRRQLSTTRNGWVKAINHAPFTNVSKNEFYPQEVDYTTPVYGEDSAEVEINLGNGPFIGVDCNRNFGTPNWGYQTRGRNDDRIGALPNTDSYFGTNYSSEAEVGNLITIIKQCCGDEVAASIDYHSYGQFIITPTESQVTFQHQRLGEIMLRLTQQPYTLGSPMQTVGYRAFSSVMDYIAYNFGSRSFTIELPPIAGTNNGFELDENLIMGAFETNIRSALALIAAASYDRTSSTSELVSAQSMAVFQQFDAWNVTGQGNRLPGEL